MWAPSTWRWPDCEMELSQVAGRDGAHPCSNVPFAARRSITALKRREACCGAAYIPVSCSADGSAPAASYKEAVRFSEAEASRAEPSNGALEGAMQVRFWGTRGSIAKSGPDVLRGQAGPLPQTPRCSATPAAGARPAGRPARPLPGPDRALAPRLPSLLDGSHAAHRDPARHGRPQSPSSLGRHIMMPHLRRRPSTSDISREHAGLAPGLPGGLDGLQSGRLARWHGHLERAKRLVPLPPASNSSRQNLPQPCQRTPHHLICGRLEAATLKQSP
jgi:hypothetical protein